MRRLLLVALIATLAVGCEKQTSKKPELQENTEAYFAAHGIVPEQVNELRIGGTLFRFPARAGLNPHTTTGIPVLANGTSEGIPLEKEPRRIVKGQADYVSLFLLNQGKGYFPTEHPRGPFYIGATGLGVEIVIGNGYRENVRDWRTSTAMKSAVLSPDNSTNLGLKKYVFDSGKNNGDKSLFYVAEEMKTPRGGSLVINCQSRYEANNGFVSEPASCSVIYQALQGFSVAYGFSGDLQLPRWKEVHLAVTSFIDSVVVN